MNKDAPTASRIGAALVNGRSRLIASRSVAPLKIVNPRSDGFCSAILSGYGGGVVQGDRVELDIECGAGAALFVGTQSFSKIYRSPGGLAASQRIRGRVGEGGLVVLLPDPVVPFAESNFVQEQEWDLEAGGALLVTADGHTAGRAARGERFAYARYASHCTVRCGGRPRLIERYESVPARLDPSGAGAFGGLGATFNCFAVGDPASPRWEALEKAVEAGVEEAGDRSGEGLLMSVGSAEPGVLAMRAAGRSAEALEPAWAIWRRALASPGLLGADPLARKF